MLFNPCKRERIDFLSNPPLGDKAMIIPTLNESGSAVNTIKRVPGNNHSPLEGIHFSREEMSLRAKLNLGVQVNRVPNVSIVSDPVDLVRTADRMESDIVNRLNELNSEPDVQPDVQPDVKPDVKPSN